MNLNKIAEITSKLSKKNPLKITNSSFQINYSQINEWGEQKFDLMYKPRETTNLEKQEKQIIEVKLKDQIVDSNNLLANL